MVSVGSKALPARRLSASDSGGDSLMREGDKSYKQGKKQRGMGRKAEKQSNGFDNYGAKKNSSGRESGGRKSSIHQAGPESQKLHVRKQVDPETARYFSDIANLFEQKEVDLEERSVICANALEETIGKELELATDYIVSHTLQMLLDGCDVDHLCCFLQSSAKVFPVISMDKSGSHVVESALKSLARHLQDTEAYSLIEETLTVICKAVVTNTLDMMCNCYSSHVFRRLLCLCKGVSLDSSELHGAKSSRVLADRLNLDTTRLNGNVLQVSHQGFQDLFSFLLAGILKCSKKDIRTLRIDQYSSLVFQTALKLSVGQDDELRHIIFVILGCNQGNKVEGTYKEIEVTSDIAELIKETAFSRLMEVVLEVAPESLYNTLFSEVFRNSFLDLSLHPCGNFVIQALVSRARNNDQMKLIWEELSPRFSDLLEQGKSGVVASIIAASQRLQSYEQKCCQALAAAVRLTNESPNCVVPRMLFLDSYFGCQDKANWKWPSGSKMHVMGSLILQEIFKFPNDFIQTYINSITSMEAEHILETAKNSSGARVIEAFLGSSASAKQKRRLIMKLRGHFGELGLHHSGSFTVEKCFDASNLLLREAIASDLSVVKAELLKTKQGPYLCRKLDIDGFAARPDQWRSRQIAKQSTYKEFFDMFGSGESKSSNKEAFLSDQSKDMSQPKELNNMRKQIEEHFSLGAPSSGMSGSKRYREGHTMVDNNTPDNRKKFKHNKVSSASAEVTDKAANNKRPFLSSETTGKKWQGKKKLRKT